MNSKLGLRSRIGWRKAVASLSGIRVSFPCRPTAAERIVLETFVHSRGTHCARDLRCTAVEQQPNIASCFKAESRKALEVFFEGLQIWLLPF